MKNISALQDFTNTRVNLQRVLDAKIFHGWIEQFSNDDVSIRADIKTPLNPLETFIFHVHGAKRDLRFIGMFQEAESTDTASLVAIALKGQGNGQISLSTKSFRFKVVSQFELLDTSEEARFSNQCMTAVITSEQKDEEEPQHLVVLDISQSGMAILSPKPLKVATEQKLELHTATGPVNAEGEVRYCREQKDGSGFYRIGLKLSLIDRVDLGRWQKCFKTAA